MSECIDVLFLGDIVGKPGRQIVSKYLDLLKNETTNYNSNSATMKFPDFIVANVENASHGFGLTQKNYNELVDMGIHSFTSGNHIWDKKDVFNFIDQSSMLIRPLNYPDGTPGEGSKIFKVGDVQIAVVNLLGRVFMNPIDSPWALIEKEVMKLKEITPIILLDFHAEATAEKISFGYFCDSLNISALIGTHTHVQTADEKILKNGCAYISDAGFCGASDGVIGMDYASSLKRLKTSLPERFDIAPMDKTELNGVRIKINKLSGRAQSIERIKYFSDLSEV